MSGLPKVFVISTATVRPQASGSVVNDPGERLAEYQQALQSNAEALRGLSGVHLILAENSGEGAAVLAAQCESLGAGFVLAPGVGSAEAAALGKGAAELRLLERAIAACDGDENAIFLKITGRLPLLNIAAIVRDARRSKSDLYSRLTWNGAFADSRMFGCTLRAFDLLISGIAEIADDRGQYLEHLLARTIARAPSRGLIWRSPGVYPRFSGRSGANGMAYGESGLRLLRQRARFQLLHFAHVAGFSATARRRQRRSLEG